jgi:hypothetical protein
MTKRNLSEKPVRKPQPGRQATAGKRSPIAALTQYLRFLQKCADRKGGDQFIEFMSAMIVQIDPTFKPGYRKSWQVNAFYNLGKIDGKLSGHIAEYLSGGPNKPGRNYLFLAEFGSFKEDRKGGAR